MNVLETTKHKIKFDELNVNIVKAMRELKPNLNLTEVGGFDKVINDFFIHCRMT